MKETLKNCPFYEGIDTCTEKECYNNILGMCVKKGSKNNDAVKPFTNYQRIKIMSIDEMVALFMKAVDTGACNDFGIPTNRECDSKCEVCIKQWLESEVKQ